MKSVLDVAADQRRQVQVAARARVDVSEQLGREGDVRALGGELRVQLGALELGLAGGDRGLDRLTGRVERHPGLPVADLAQGELELALPSEILHARLVEVGERGRGRDRVQRVLLERLRVHAATVSL